MKQSEKQGAKNKIGAYGEEIAVNYLKKQGFKILATNYLKKWGEIDVVAHETVNNREIMHFVEVKTLSYGTKEDLKRAVSYGTHRPEENVHYKKIQRLSRTIESWISENKYNGPWQIDVTAIRVVPREKYATIKHIPNVILD